MTPAAPTDPRPNPLPLGERFVSYGIRAPLFFLVTAFYGSLALLASLFDSHGGLQHRIAQAWARASVVISGVRLTILNGERLTGQPAVYACNHLSYMDTPVLFSALPFQFRILARDDLWTMPFIGWYLNRSGQVPIRVGEGRASVSSLLTAARTLKSGMPLFVFPEGGRTEDGHLAEFMNGPAFLAIRAQLPIVPMALAGTWELLPMHSGCIHPVPVTLAVGEPIDTRGLTMRQVDELTQTLRERVAALYYEHSWLSRPASAASPGTTDPANSAPSGDAAQSVQRDGVKLEAVAVPGSMDPAQRRNPS